MAIFALTSFPFLFYPQNLLKIALHLLKIHFFTLDQQLKMGSIPGTLMAGKQTKTAVQQICIDQNSGQIRGRKEREEYQQRLSSAIELAEGKLKWRGRFGNRKRADSANRKASLNLELANVQRRLTESERAKNELEIQLRTMEREKRELEADWARRNAEIEIHPNSVGHILEEEIVEEQQMRQKCHCGGWIWEEEKLAQNLRERDEFWAKRMAEEMAKRLKLIEAIEAKYGGNELAELLEEEGEKGKQTNQIKRPSTIGSNERISNANDNLERRKSDPRFENPCSILTPPTRLSTASTLQSARINDNGQSQQNGTLFRPSLNLRRQNLAAKGNNINKGSPANILELEGICLDEKGILVEESEGEIEEEELQKNERSHENDNQRRASTSAKSRDSGISY